MIITETSVPLMCGTLMSPSSTVRECVDSSSRAILFPNQNTRTSVSLVGLGAKAFILRMFQFTGYFIR